MKLKLAIFLILFQLCPILIQAFTSSIALHKRCRSRAHDVSHLQAVLDADADADVDTDADADGTMEESGTEDGEIADNDEVIRYRGRVAYDGSGYGGWQIQAHGGRTGQVKRCMSQLLVTTIFVICCGIPFTHSSLNLVLFKYRAN